MPRTVPKTAAHTATGSRPVKITQVLRCPEQNIKPPWQNRYLISLSPWRTRDKVVRSNFARGSPNGELRVFKKGRAEVRASDRRGYRSYGKTVPSGEQMPGDGQVAQIRLGKSRLERPFGWREHPPRWGRKSICLPAKLDRMTILIPSPSSRNGAFHYVCSTPASLSPRPRQTRRG